MRFSVIVAFKNRDEVRAKNFFDSLQWQTIKDFEVILVNQGSDDDVNDWVEPLVAKYLFASYIYNSTQGYLWNKSNALNIGIKKANGIYIVIADIDIIFPADFIKKIEDAILPGCFLTHNAFYIPQNFAFNEMESLFELDNIKSFHENFIGLCVVKKEVLLSIHGYDEYYLVWGAEDDDIIRRLEMLGEKRLHLSASLVNIFHQWHPTNAPARLSYWYLSMLNYLNLDSIDKKWRTEEFGRLTERSERTIMTLMNEPASFQKLGVLEHPLFKFALFYEEFIKMDADDFGQFEFVIEDNVPLLHGRKQKLVSILNNILLKSNSKYKIESKIKNLPTLSRENWYNFVVFFIGKNRSYLKDYYVLNTDKELTFFFQKK